MRPASPQSLRAGDRLPDPRPVTPAVNDRSSLSTRPNSVTLVPAHSVRPAPRWPRELGFGEFEDALVTVTGTASETISRGGVCGLPLHANDVHWEALLPRRWRDLPVLGCPWKHGGVDRDASSIVWMEGRRFPVQTTILLRSPADIRIVSQPSWWRTLPFGKLLLAVAIVSLVALIWVWQLRRQVKSQTAHIEEQKVRTRACSREGRGSLTPEERVPGQHEPRNPHPHERRPGHDRGFARQRSELGPARRPAHRPLLGRFAADGPLNDILDFSKIEAGKLALDPIPFSLRDCMEETIRAVAFTAAQRKVLEFICDIEPAIPEFIIGDPHPAPPDPDQPRAAMPSSSPITVRSPCRCADRIGPARLAGVALHGPRYRYRAFPRRSRP